jgi:hypothetical protein
MEKLPLISDWLNPSLIFTPNKTKFAKSDEKDTWKLHWLLWIGGSCDYVSD